MFKTAVNKALQGFVFVHHGAGPATKPRGRSAAGRGIAGIYHERAFSALRIAVEGHELMVGTAPRWAALQQEDPNFFRGQVYNRTIDPAAPHVVMRIQPLAVVVAARALEP